MGPKHANIVDPALAPKCLLLLNSTLKTWTMMVLCCTEVLSQTDSLDALICETITL